MSFEVVIFLDDHSVDAVPSNWVSNDVCYWPPYRASRMETAKKKREEPTDAWTKNNARSLGCYDARARLNRAMETSTLETDDDEATGSGKSRRKRKQKMFSDVEDDNSDAEERSASTQVKHGKHTTPDVPVPVGLLSAGLTSFPSPPEKLKMAKSASSSKSVGTPVGHKDSQSLSSGGAKSASSSKSVGTPVRHKDSQSQSSGGAKSASSSKSVGTPVGHKDSQSLSSGGAKSASSSKSVDVPETFKIMETAQFQRRVLYQFAQLSRDITNLHKLIEQQSLTKPSIATEELPDMAVCNGPMNELADVGRLNSLCDEDDHVREFLVFLLRRYRGHTMKHTVKSMMARLFTNYCMSFLSMCGRNLEKRAFRKMPVCNIVVDCVLEHHPAPLSAVYRAIGNYLKMAPWREGGAGKGASLVSGYASVASDERHSDMEQDGWEEGDGSDSEEPTDDDSTSQLRDSCSDVEPQEVISSEQQLNHSDDADDVESE